MIKCDHDILTLYTDHSFLSVTVRFLFYFAPKMRCELENCSNVLLSKKCGSMMGQIGQMRRNNLLQVQAKRGTDSAN